jgi:hypothetical protein
MAQASVVRRLSRRVGGTSELGVNAGNGLASGDEEAGEVLGEVAALRFVGEEVVEVTQGFLNNLGEVDDAGHGGASQSEGLAPDNVRLFSFKTSISELCKRPDKRLFSSN